MGAKATAEILTAGRMWPRFTTMPPSKLRVDQRYQRPVSRLAARIAKYFEPQLFGTLIISRRSDGSHTIIDGQTRWTAACQLGLREVPCLIHNHLTPQDEARLFTTLQLERLSIRPFHRFRAQVFQRHPTAVSIQRIVRQAGWRIERDRKQETDVTAVVALEWVYARGGAPMLASVFAVINRAWAKKHPEAVSGEILRALGVVLSSQDVPTTVGLIGDRTPGQLMTEAARYREGRHGGKNPKWVAKAIMAGA